MSRTRKIVLAVLGVLLALVVIVFLCIALIISSLREQEPAVADHSVLVLKIGGALPDYATEDPLARAFGAQSNSLTSLLTQLKKAKADKRIDAVLLDIDFVGAGWAKADEIRDAVADFRTSGKPVYAYMEYGADKELYIASAADRVYVAPIGDLFINGLAAQAMFFRGSLDKLGVYPDFYQIGKYKNAPDSYTRKEMSEPHREVVNAVLDDHFNRYVTNLASARKKSPEDIIALINRAPIRSRDAESAGLIDGALYREQVETELKKRLGYKDDEKLKTVTGTAYRRVSQESLGLNEGERVAVIYASGIINSGQSDDGSFGGEQMAGSDTLVKAINDARDDKSVKAIVLRVDSPGGGSYPSDLVWQAVEKAKEKKPVVASMSDLAASGGYYISMNASRIVAQPSTITGSIGVFAGKPVIKGFYDWIGVSTEYVLRGEQAGMFRETERFTDTERARFESLVRSFYYDDFLPKVAKGRGKDVEYVDSVAQGRVWTGAQAKERGLVDEFGGLDRAVEVAKELAGIPADKGVRRVIYPAPRTFFQQLFDTEDAAQVKARREEQALINSLPEDMRRAFRYARMFDRMKRGEVMAMLPFELTIE
ncbi:MAG TPA: signal peptide peptidase SppA [Pyrinomonadaceae bacterium]|nr:signal peptide peptidase SppA [Pyrinomonadaceae bacterium]